MQITEPTILIEPLAEETGGYEIREMEPHIRGPRYFLLSSRFICFQRLTEETKAQGMRLGKKVNCACQTTLLDNQFSSTQTEVDNKFLMCHISCSICQARFPSIHNQHWNHFLFKTNFTEANILEVFSLTTSFENIPFYLLKQLEF